MTPILEQQQQWQQLRQLSRQTEATQSRDCSGPAAGRCMYTPAHQQTTFNISPALNILSTNW